MQKTEIADVLLSICAERPSVTFAGEDIDLDAWFPLANRHGGAPLVSRALSGLPAGAELRRDREADIRRGWIFTDGLSRPEDLLVAAGMPLRPLRGPVLRSPLSGR